MKRCLAFSWLLSAAFLLSIPVQAGVSGRIVLGAQPLAGFQHYAGKRVWDELKVGDALTLTRESDNAYDTNAIRVEWHGEKLGYVPRAGNDTIAKLMDKGSKVSGRIVHLKSGRSHWQRILFEVLLEE